MNKAATLLLTVIAICCACSATMANDRTNILKNYTFEKKKASAEWSAGKTFVVGENRRLGLFNDRNKRYPSQTVLTLSGIPSGKSITVKFDLLFIGSWDSEGKLADKFTVSIPERTVLLELTEFPCTLIDNDDSRPVNNNGFVRVGERDRAYWIESITVEVPAELISDNTLSLEFKGFLTGRKTEFWAIDDVQIIIPPAN